jgi:hypothetical protein
MFKKLLQSLTRSTPQPAPKPAPPAAPASKAGSLLDKVGGTKPPPAAAPAPAAKAQKAAEKPASPPRKLTPEEMCEITPKMSKDEIRAHLKLLYRRFNRGASSLDAKVRDEADAMLDAIVAVREKTFGEI